MEWNDITIIELTNYKIRNTNLKFSNVEPMDNGISVATLLIIDCGMDNDQYQHLHSLLWRRIVHSNNISNEMTSRIILYQFGLERMVKMGNAFRIFT